MAYNLSRKGDRERLKPRSEPYWASEPLSQALYLGYRRHRNGGGSWIVRFRESGGQQRTSSLGRDAKDLDYLTAKKAALKWHDRTILRGVLDKPPTLRRAAEGYLAYVLKDPIGHRLNRQRAHGDAKWRIDRYINKNGLADIPIDKIREEEIQKWFDGLEGQAASKNRNLMLMKAILNYAVKLRRVPAEMANEWRRVKRIKIARHERRRDDVYLTVAERKAIIDACEGNFKDYLLAVVLTGCRPGDPARVRAEDFDGKGVIFRTKVAPTRVPLSPAAQRLFWRLAKKKTPKAFLFPRRGADPYKYSNDWARPFREAVNDAVKNRKLPKDKARKAVLYSVRHSFITDALRSGEIRAFEVAEICRTSVRMIEDHYAHVIPGDIEQRLAAVPMS